MDDINGDDLNENAVDTRGSRPKRGGGRLARHALRVAPLATDVKPVHPGLNGGQYRPLTNVQIQKIEQTIYQILGEIGLSQASALMSSAMFVLMDRAIILAISRPCR